GKVANGDKQYSPARIAGSLVKYPPLAESEQQIIRKLCDNFSVGNLVDRQPSDSRWAILSVIFDDKKRNMNSEQTQKLAEKIYEGFSEEDIVEMEKVMLDRSNFFDQGRVRRRD
ncbi:MAG TPA: hypothetical protein PKY59_06770, partial [Pyrinomonadaceae bacterium]|nr:hypothetical protein [Pyrinomonadaceae bacterium]